MHFYFKGIILVLHFYDINATFDLRMHGILVIPGGFFFSISFFQKLTQKTQFFQKYSFIRKSVLSVDENRHKIK